MTTLAEATAMLSAYTTAEAQILLGKEVRLGGVGLDRWLKMEDLAAVREGRKEWEKRVTALTDAASGAAAPRFGGVRFSLADVSNPRLW